MPKVLESASSQGMSNLQERLRLAILQRYKMFWFDECLPKIILRAGRQKGRFDNVGARRGIFAQSGLRNHKPFNFWGHIR